MLKKIFIKNGIIMISEKNNMEINYIIINNYKAKDKYKDKDKYKAYYEKKGCKYD